MTYPRLAVGIITYNRPREFDAVLEAYIRFLKYPADRITFVLSDDGSAEDYLSEWTARSEFEWVILRHDRLGMPGNWNAMIAECEQHADFTLCAQDDWLLTEPLDLRLGVAFLLANPNYGMVRYHKTTGHTGLTHIIHEWDTRTTLDGFHLSDNEYAPYMLPYFDVRPNNSDIYSPYSGGVHLRHKRFTACYGGYTERIGFSNAEMDFMQRVNKGLRENPDIVQRVALFPHYVESRFQDIGESYRGTATERETMR